MTVATNDQNDRKLPVPLVGRMNGLDEAFRLAANIAQARIVPNDLQNKPNDVLVTILYGQDLGLTPMQAIQSLYVVKGKPFISGQLWLALVRRAGHRAEITGDDKSATCTITRGDTGEQHTERFTLEQARTAKLLGGSGDSNWSKYPDRMLRWRAVANCARMICSEVALGFMSEGEQPDEPIDAKPTLAQVAEQRVDSTTGEVHDAEVVDDDETRRQVEQLAAKHAAEPTDEDIAAMNAEAAAQQSDDAPPSDLFGDDR